MGTQKKAMLIIMDGWGHGKNAAASAIAAANTPNVDSYYTRYPNAELRTDGPFVGLPEGQMGNSEVGHLNLGAGRVVFQELQRIFNAIDSGELARNEVLQDAFRQAVEKGKLHLMGLVSDGGVHSHTQHLKALCKLAIEAGVPAEKVFVHVFTDGRDTDPKSGVTYVGDLVKSLEGSGIRIASVSGRYYAMDRDKRWERISLAWKALVKGEGHTATDALDAIRKSYDQGVTDEFIEPVVITDGQQPLATIEENDTVLCFNFRTDRCRQITRALTQDEFPDQGMHTLQLHYVTMTRYDHTFKGVEVLFEKEDLTDTMGEVLEKQGLTQVRIAETEKYPHVTFFFSGGREKEFKGERRIMKSSPKVATYDLQPEMSAPEVKDAIVQEIRNNPPDFICLNFANPDMVGHTGVFSAAVKACETIDTCVGEAVDAALEQGYAIILTADHGNSDYLVNPDGSPNTAHTTNPVPVFYIDRNPAFKHIRHGKLGDVAPTLLRIMDIEIPESMTGEILVQ